MAYYIMIHPLPIAGKLCIKTLVATNKCTHIVYRNTETNSGFSYLDLEINIRDKKFTTAVFNKRDGFSFHMVNFHTWIVTYLANQPTGFIHLN